MQRPLCLLLPDAGRSVIMNRICCFLFFGRSTLRPYMPTSPHPHMPTCPHVYRSCFTMRVGTLRAASVLFPVFGCCMQRRSVLYLLFCVFRTQHAASLLVCMFNLNRALDSFALMKQFSSNLFSCYLITRESYCFLNTMKLLFKN